MAIVTPRDPALDYVTITPDDDADLPGGITRAIVVGTAGDIKSSTASGNVRTAYFPVGMFPIQLRRVYATGTDAANIVALY